MPYDNVTMRWINADEGAKAALGYEPSPEVAAAYRRGMALAGHAGDCTKVTTATVKGTTDARCSCGAEQ